MKRNLLKRLLLSVAMVPLMQGASGSGGDEREIAKRMATAASASTSATSAAPSQTSIQDLDLAAQNVLGKYDLFLGYNDFIRANPSEIGLAASNLRQAKTAFKDARVHSQEWTQGLNFYLQELIRGNMTALEHVATNTGDYARLMPHVFGEERTKHWQSFYKDVNVLKMNLSKEDKATLKCTLALNLYNATPQGRTNRDLKERRLYVERALGFVTVQDLQAALQNDIKSTETDIARVIVMTICDHITTPYTPYSEKIKFMERDIFKPMIDLALHFLAQGNNENLDRLQTTSFVQLLLMYSDYLSLQSNSLDTRQTVIHYLENITQTVPQEARDICNVTLAQKYLVNHQNFPLEFPYNSEIFSNWFNAARRILKEKENLFEEYVGDVTLAAYVQYVLLKNNVFMATQRKDLRPFDLTIASIRILAKQEKTKNNKWKTQEELEIYQELLRHRTDTQERRNVIKYLNSDEYQLHKEPKEHNELLSLLNRNLIKNINFISPDIIPVLLEEYAQFIKTGETSINLNNQPLSKKNKYKQAAALFVRSGTQGSKNYLYEMLVAGQLQEAELLQILSDNQVDLDSPMNPTKLIQKLRKSSPYYQALFHFHRAQNTVGDVIVDLTKALEYLEKCSPNPEIDANKALILSLLEQKGQRSKIDSQEAPPPQEIRNESDSASEGTDDSGDSEDAPMADRKGKWKATPPNFVNSRERLRLAIAQSKLPSFGGREQSPEQLAFVGVNVYSPLAQEDYEKLSPLQKLVLVDILKALSAGENFRHMETLKGFKPITGVPLNQGIEIKSVHIEGVHRLVYSQEGSKITVYRCYGHYDDNIPGVKQ